MLRNTLILSLFSLLLANCSSIGVSVEVYNPLEVKRSELITLERNELLDKLDCDLPIRVMDPRGDTLLPTQFLDLDLDQTWEAILVQVVMDPLETCMLQVENTQSTPANVNPKVFGRFVPERKDDFAWENDRIAFRMYGPALEATGEISSGVDVWVKSVDKLIIDKWYALEDYHKDHGEGADFYKVGPTLGAGGLGLLVGDTLFASKNFTDQRILAQGPLRFVFELDYAIWGPDSIQIEETKRITLDAGQHFNSISSHLKLSRALPDSAKFVSGLLAHPALSPIPVSLDSLDDYMIMYEGFKGNNGEVGTAVIRSAVFGNESIKKYGDQYLMTHSISSDGSLNYDAGAAWTKGPWINSEHDWKNLVMAYQASLKNPFQVTIKKH
ncbi:MAG: DUF4861 family protein [Candidatus Marinimicrobia bacterium]|nr:DUF4861 family protein [Candidatus Neomarinimicrobiota bacterium]